MDHESSLIYSIQKILDPQNGRDKTVRAINDSIFNDRLHRLNLLTRDYWPAAISSSFGGCCIFPWFLYLHLLGNESMMKDKESKGKEGLEFLLAINPFLSQALQEINENKRKQRPGERIRMQMKNEITSIFHILDLRILDFLWFSVEIWSKMWTMKDSRTRPLLFCMDFCSNLW